MIKRLDNWSNEPPERPQSEILSRRPLIPEIESGIESSLLPPKSSYLITRKIEDTQLAITFSYIFTEAPAAPKHISLARSKPLLFSPLDQAGIPIVTYALDSEKLSDKQRRALADLLVEIEAQRSRGDHATTTLHLLKVIFNRTSKIKDAWSTELPNGKPVDRSSYSPLMMLHIPTVRGYLKEPSKLGRVYQSRAGEELNARTVIVELDPIHNQARFILREHGAEALGAIFKPIVIAVPGSAQGALCTETAMRHLRVLSWNALERLRDEGPGQFYRHLRQLGLSKHSVHIKNLSTNASFQVVAAPAETQIILASRPFRATGMQDPPPARNVWSFPGNMQDPDHPLHALLVDISSAVKRPDADRQLEGTINRLVEASQDCARATMASHAPSLQGIFDSLTLQRLQSIPGVSIEPVAPGELVSTIPNDDTVGPAALGNTHLSRAIVEVAQGISRIRLRPIDMENWRNFPAAFHALTLDVYPDQSFLLRANNDVGAILQCFLSRQSRFPKHFPVDTAEIVCRTFTRQIEDDSLLESRSSLLHVLAALVTLDSEHNFLRYRAVPPSGSH